MAGLDNIIVKSVGGGCRNGCTVSMAMARHFDRSHAMLWEQATAGTLNRAACDRCGTIVDADLPLVYTDLARATAMTVFPAGSDIGRAEPPATVMTEISLDAHMPLRHGRIAGLGAFQEYLLLVEMGISFAALAEAKSHLIVNDRLLLTFRKPRLQLVAIDPADTTNPQVYFAVSGEGVPTDTRISADRALLVAIDREIMAARQSLAGRRARRRRFIGRPGAEDLDWPADIASGFANDPALAKLADIVRRAFARNRFNGSAAAAMARLVAANAIPIDDALAMFEDATSITLSPDLKAQLAKPTRGQLSPAVVLWWAVADLPWRLRQRHMLTLDEIGIDHGLQQGAMYVPDMDGTKDEDAIALSFGIVQSRRFRHALRHEIGHAIHDSYPVAINAWLTEQFGWRWHTLPQKALSGDDPALMTAVDGWIADLGGWQAAAPSAADQGQKAALRQMLFYAAHCRDTPLPGESLSRFRDDLGDRPDWFGDSLPRQVYLATPGDWWKAHARWLELQPIDPGGPKRLAMINYRYRELATVSVTARDLVDAGLIDAYAMMSQREFFAEFYASWRRRRSRLREKFPDFFVFLNSLADQQQERTN